MMFVAGVVLYLQGRITLLLVGVVAADLAFAAAFIAAIQPKAPHKSTL